MITHGANTVVQSMQGVQGMKPLLGSANTVQCQVRGSEGEALAGSANVVECKG